MKIIKCVMPVLICAALASSGTNDNTSVSTPEGTPSQEISTTAVTSAKTDVEVISDETD